MKILPVVLALANVAFFSILSASADDLHDLRRAVEQDHVPGVHKLIQAGKATVDTWVYPPGFDNRGLPILGLAAREGSERVTEYLIQARANLNARPHTKESPLMLAALFPDEIGGDPSVYDKHERIARQLIDAGADLENEPGEFTPLAYSAYYGHIRITRYLLEKGALVDGGVVDGVARSNTALIFAAMNGHKETVRLLLEHGADVRIANSWGNDAVYYAKKNNQNHVLPDLLCARDLQAGETFAEKCSKPSWSWGRGLF
ncbi:MAG: ankyrin repeat domain-containing protein [Oligoflexia bacterium]|nr:ankyrin repeat domain-containing protein [Oligoflexia bacterium]